MRPAVFLAAPYGQVGGGMGSIAAYLASLGSIGGFEMRRLETRGDRVTSFPYHLAIGVLRMAHQAMWRQCVLHINVAERGSTIRKHMFLVAAKLMGMPVLLHLHAAQIATFYQQLPAHRRWLVRKMFQSANHCVVLGEASRRWLIETMTVKPEAITLIRNGVPFAPMVRQASRQDRFRLLFLGNLLERKGISDLLHVMARLADCTLTAVGGSRDDIEKYQQLARSLDIAERVTFTGWLDQQAARGWMAQADALILPSYDEVLPLVILEALAAKVPVICTPVGAIPEVLADGHSALFVTPGDQQGMVATIRRLRDDGSLQQHLAEQGHQLYCQSFTMEAFTAQLAVVYRDLIAPPMARIETVR